MTGLAILPQKMRVLLILGRVSNLPTVWSNCFAAWFLGGSGRGQDFALLCVGATLLYTGGMFLNDAFDVEFDRKYRSERPIVAAQVSLRFVWITGVTCLVFGWLALVPLGGRAATFGGLLLTAIVLYDAVHKKTTLAPLLMATCRFLLYLLAASAAQLGAGRSAIWFAFALFCYIVGLSYFARVESAGGMVSRWPAALLVVPIVVAILRSSRTAAPLWIALVVQPLWVVWCLTGGLRRGKQLLPGGVAGLLAGIPFVDWLAVGCCISPELALAFPGFFLGALLLQRFAPAT